MTIDEFKSQLSKIGFHPDKTSACDDMMVNMSFLYPVNTKANKWVPLKTAVMFFEDCYVKPYFTVQIATPDNKRFSWGAYTSTLSTAPSASVVLVYAIGEIIYKYKPIFSLR